MSFKMSVFMAISLDGFIARKDGSLDWLQSGPDDTEDYGYAAFFDSIDVLVMGRATFEQVLTFEEWPYGQERVVVQSRHALEIPPALSLIVSASSETPQELARRLQAEGSSNVYVDGGATVRRFLEAGLIDEMTLTRLPVLLGDGIPLFGGLPHDIHLQHQRTRSWPNGYVQSRYRILRE